MLDIYDEKNVRAVELSGIIVYIETLHDHPEGKKYRVFTDPMSDDYDYID